MSQEGAVEPLIPLIASIVILPLIGFYFWMFNDLSNNEYLSSAEKSNWTIRFVFLSVFAAAWYYRDEYRPRHL